MGYYARMGMITALGIVIAAMHFRVIGEVTPLHALHYRLNYIPILLAATWFGRTGGLVTAGAIILVYLPATVLGENAEHLGKTSTYLEFVMYLVIGLIVGELVTRRVEAASRAERAERLAAIGEMAAMVAHEVRNPLQAIKGALDEMRDLECDRGLVSGAREEARRLEALVEDVLLFGRPRRKVEVEAEVDLIIRRAVASPPGEVRSDAVIETIPSNLTMVSDPERMARAVRNLVENALAAAGPGGKVRVSASAISGGGVRLTVEDSGPGVSPEEERRIFDPFVTKRRGGTGLGLAIAERIVKDHGGRISVADSPLGGAAFIIEIPGGPDA